MFESLTDDQLLEVVAERERVISAAAAEQAQAIVLLLERRGAQAEFGVAEIGWELHLTSVAAQAKAELAQGLVELPLVWSGLAAGVLDVGRARVLVEGLGCLSAAVLAALEPRAVAYAAEHTTSQIRAWLGRWIAKLEPEALARRARAARSERRVTYTPAADGMAELWARLPAAQARAVYESLTHLAEKSPQRLPVLQAEGWGERTRDARRADALVALCTGAFDRLGVPRPGWLHPEAGGQGWAVQLNVTVPMSSLLGVGSEPGELAGHGPIPEPMLAELAQDGTWLRLLTDPASGALLDVGTTTYRPPAPLRRFVVLRDRTCSAPGCSRPAASADLDHLVPFPNGPTSADNLHPLCRFHHRLKQQPGWQVVRERDGTTVWTSPAGRVYTNVSEPVGVPDVELAPIRPAPELPPQLLLVPEP